MVQLDGAGLGEEQLPRFLVLFFGFDGEEVEGECVEGLDRFEESLMIQLHLLKV